MIDDMIVTTVSKGRSELIKNRTLKFFPDATVVCHESEEKDYAKVARNVVCHDVKGICAIRQWVLDTFKEEMVVQLDDELKGITSLVGLKTRRIEDPEETLRILENTALATKDIGCSLFGFNRHSKPLYFSGISPFLFSGMIVCAVLGFVGRSLNFDETLVLNSDVDINMQALLQDRVYVCDTRYHFDFGQVNEQKGGLQGTRTEQLELQEQEKIVQKWGRYLSYKKLKADPLFHVPRKNPLAVFR